MDIEFLTHGVAEKLHLHNVIRLIGCSSLQNAIHQPMDVCSGVEYGLGCY
jgi:hypothetical protein